MHSSNTDGRVARRNRRFSRTVVALLTVALALSTTTAIAATAGAQSTNKILGPKNAAKGEPVKIGFIGSGRSANLDNQYQNELADAITSYINEYKGGIGGRPIDLHQCTSGASNAAKAQECANQLINDGVVMIISPDYDMVSAVHTVTAAANMPYFIYSITDPAILTDSKAMFQLSDASARVYQMPIDVAKKAKIKSVTAIVLDVPAATTIYTSPEGKAKFADAGLQLTVVPIPFGQADLTPQMASIANGPPTTVTLSNTDQGCIASFKGLQANGYKGPMSSSYTCITDVTRQAVGSYLKGVYIAVAVPIGDAEDKDVKLMTAIRDKYSSAAEVPDLNRAHFTFSTYMSVWQALADMKGTISPATITSTLKAMPTMKIVGGGGLIYRCNGKANPAQPALCSVGTLSSQLDAQGYPKLPYKTLNNKPIPD